MEETKTTKKWVKITVYGRFYGDFHYSRWEGDNTTYKFYDLNDELMLILPVIGTALWF